ncbi:MAG: tyrosine recombinase XerC [Rhodocyclaceae bacterium]|nr:tyrosine recombinase XerC [Rhodocyclaceae bacterium]
MYTYTPPASLPALMQTYLAWQREQRRASAHTQEHSARDLARLAELAEGRALLALDSRDIRAGLVRLRAQGLSGTSLARVLSSWRSFYRWALLHGHCEANPAQGVRAPKTPQRLPKALSVDRTQALLDAPVEAEAPNARLGVRDRAMFELFYATGLRLSELGGLTLAHAAQIEQGMLTVTGKRGVTRSVPVGAKAQQAVAAWCALRGAVHSDELLFVTRTGTGMSPPAIRARLRVWAQVSGIGQHVHPHMLRHSFASHMLQSSGDLRAVQELLGHGSLRSTQVYTHLDFQHLAKVYDRAHPRAHKGGADGQK